MSLARFARIFVAIALTAAALWMADPDRVLPAARAAEPRWIAMAVALVLLDRTLMAYRWLVLLRAIAPGQGPPLGLVLRVFFTSTFVGTFLPSIGGDVYRAYHLTRQSVPGAESTASVLMDRALGVVAMVALGGAAALWAGADVRGSLWVVLGITTAGCILAAIAVFSRSTARMIGRTTEDVLPRPLHAKAKALADATRRYSSRPGALLSVALMSLAVQVLRVVQAWCLGRSLGIHAGLGAYFVLIPIILIVMQLPITIAGLGTGQIAFTTLFAQVGVPEAQSFALSVLFIALGFVGNLPGAVLFMMHRPRAGPAT